MSDGSRQRPEDAEARTGEPPKPAPTGRPRPLAGFALPRFRDLASPAGAPASLRSAPTAPARPQSRAMPGTAMPAAPDVGTSYRPPVRQPVPVESSDVGTSSRNHERPVQPTATTGGRRDAGPHGAPGKASDVGTSSGWMQADADSPFPDFAPDPQPEDVAVRLASRPMRTLDLRPGYQKPQQGTPERRAGQPDRPPTAIGQRPASPAARPDDVAARPPARVPVEVGTDRREPTADGRPVEVAARAGASGDAEASDAVRNAPTVARREEGGDRPGEAYRFRIETVDGSNDQPVPDDLKDVPRRDPGRTVADKVRRIKSDIYLRTEGEKTEGRPEGRLGTVAVDRTEKTKQHYLMSAERLRKRYAREKRTSVEEIDPHLFALWFVSLRGTLKPSTWRVYKQGVLVALEMHQDDEAVRAARDVIEAEARFDHEMDAPQDETAETTRKTVTSANKARYFAYEDLEQLEAWLLVHSRTDAALDLIDWLRAGVATGLRPVEWTGSEVYEVPDPTARRGKRTYLFVRNAKATNGRGNGLTRTIDVTDFPDGTIAIVERLSRNARRWEEEGTYQLVMYKCTNLLFRTGNRLWPRRRKSHYTLYSCRHQFTLNMRVLGMDEAEIAALLGHNVTKTQNAHYGKRAKGWSPDKILERPRGNADEIATVRRVENFAKERERLRRIAKGVRDDVAPGAEGPDAGTPATEV